MSAFMYGPANSGWIPIAGDWNQRHGHGRLVRPGHVHVLPEQQQYQRKCQTTFMYGPANSGWIPIVGDWDGNGTDTVGLYDPATSTFYLNNSNTGGNADVAFMYGPANSGWTSPCGRLEWRWHGHHRSVRPGHVHVLSEE